MCSLNDATDNCTQQAYVFGHSHRELERLSVQGRLLGPITRGFLRDGGVGPGMRVLDVGSGVGDVSFLAAELVGEAGEVLGVDRAPAAIEAATQRADALSLRNVGFRQGDPSEMTFERPFDAVIGRYVLQFQPDPIMMVRKLVRHVRPGGAVVFHEPDWHYMRSVPPVSTFNRCCQWIVDALRLGGADPWMGTKLHSTFVGAGLPPPAMRLEAVIAAGTNSSDQVRYTTDVAVTLVDQMVRLGVATAGEVDAERLADRIVAELIDSGGVVVGRCEIGAWSHT
jgi:2-polyprenyl-3-methyl-5-hydroxy-6-metoxy-1,4-benzoquinol methylase